MEEKNERGEWRNEGCVLWRGSRRGMERGKLWIGVWMRENEREGGGGKFMEVERERVGEQLNCKNFQISNYEGEFQKIHINSGRERIVQPLKGCRLLRRNFDHFERMTPSNVRVSFEGF